VRPSTSPTPPRQRCSPPSGSSGSGRLAEEIVGKYGNRAEDETSELLDWLDSRTERNLVITFGGGVEAGVMRSDGGRQASVRDFPR